MLQMLWRRHVRAHILIWTHILHGHLTGPKRQPPTPMTPSSRGALLRFGLLVGLISGCAHGKATGEGEGDNAPEPSKPVTAEDIQRAGNEPIERALMAKVPGVWITRTPDGGIAIRIRGTTSLNASNAPLYVVDGMAIQAGPNGSLTGINPYDIETIEVLKDAASTSMYGSRGANGVIIIKTKRSRQ